MTEKIKPRERMILYSSNPREPPVVTSKEEHDYYEKISSEGFLNLLLNLENRALELKQWQG